MFICESNLLGFKLRFRTIIHDHLGVRIILDQESELEDSGLTVVLN